MADTTIRLHFNGREGAAELPPLLAASSRSTGGASDVFLPTSYLVAERSFDVGPAARSVADGSAAIVHAATPGEIIVLELADGSTLITSAERLRASLAQTQPQLVGSDAAGDKVLLEQLREIGAAPNRGFGEAAGGLISKVYTLIAGAAPDVIIGDALVRLSPTAQAAELGVTWVGTRALMAAIEARLAQAPGLYQWCGASGQASDLVAARLIDNFDTPQAAPEAHPMLVFVHGTGANTLGSFGDLRTGDRDLWGALQSRFGDRIYAFEHRTFSESPIENAIALAESLPRGAHVSLVSHSRGGLVADLLCLGDFDALIDGYHYVFPGGTGDPPAESARVKPELDQAHAEQRVLLRTLAKTLRDRRIVVERYVRAASPASGTKLASGNFDVFLSGLLNLVGAVPFFFGNPIYSALKRIVIEIAKNRTNAHLVPGIEAMLPDSPMARLLRDAPIRPGTAMAVIAGDIQGGNLLKRLGVLLTDFLIFDSEDNDLVVNTPSMLAGIAPKAGSRVLFDRGADVSHFRYFSNIDTRSALRDWLLVDEPALLPTFRALPSAADYAAALAEAATRDALATDRPIVVVLPGVMGSHLRVGGKDRVWFDPLDIASGGLSKIEWGKDSVEADELFAMFYGKVCAYLSASHRVERFAYDWRQPLDVLAERLGQFLDRLMAETQQPIRLLAHSMGGLVVRACIHKRRSVMDALMAREGARLVMLGTPHQGAHSMVENLLGKGDTLRTLVRLDLTHSMQEVLDIVAGFRGALQLLPKPGFVDTFQDLPEGGKKLAYQRAETWVDLKAKVTDFWFGSQLAGTPAQDVLDQAAWLWTADGSDRPALPADYETASVYVFGVAANTACGVREVQQSDGSVRVKMVGTTRGDGTVTWDSGRIGGIGSYYYMPAQHGDLPATEEHFPALADLLTSGTTGRLSTLPPAVRAIAQAVPYTYDAGPPNADDPDALQRGLMGGSLRNRVPPRPKRRLEVTVRAMDLRFISQPIMVGHYEQDPIAGAEALIDRELLTNDLSERHSLGLYAGARGTASVVLRVPNEIERKRGSLSGAVVVGLGRYDGALSPADLTDAVRAGALRYLLQVIDVLGKGDREVPLASLLLGFNSSANLTVSASVEALLRGVMEANAKFYDTTRLNIRIHRLDIVEMYLDTAITAVYALRQLGDRLEAQASQHRTALVCRRELVHGEGLRQRLFDERSASYWPRLIITDADRDADHCETQAAPLAPGALRAPTRIADRLRFLYVGQRARAESVVQQRQPGLIEELVRQQIHDARWNENFGRTLFQLMVPHDFKDAARQLDRVVLVVDACTANLPWELMLADDPSRRDASGADDKRPLALRSAVVRQLSSSRYRAQVRQAIDRRALVIGNPSVAGFDAAFPAPAGQVRGPVPPLPGAEAEARATLATLRSIGYDVEPVIGADKTAIDVFAKLYQQPWRIVHISAHGVFDLPHADGRTRSGVLLSGGLLITAAEIAAMEVVPDLVFLNCCHLGQVDVGGGGSGNFGNKLAASIARELIDIGVRCVVVAGWAVGDEAARLFAQTFYEQLLLRRKSFGDAVFEARGATWRANRDDITWGAFQAYGDPGWLPEARADGPASTGADAMCASPDELLDELARTRAELSRRRGSMTEREIRAQADAVESLIRQRCPPGWKAMPQVQSALGMTWFELNEMERARASFLAAIQADDAGGVVPIRDIERLVNAELRLGAKRAEQEIDQVAGSAAGLSGEALIDAALKRLDGLDKLIALQPDGEAPGLGPVSAERSRLLGSAWKRKASLCARRLLRGPLEPALATTLRDQMLGDITRAAAAYQSAEGRPGSSRFVPYLALNRLALDALTAWDDPAERDAAIALARQCGNSADECFALNPTSWDAVVRPDALLVEMLLDGSLARADDVGRSKFEEVAQAYAEAMNHVTVKPSQIAAIVAQMELMSRLCDALSVVNFNDAALVLTAARLIDLAQRVQPGRRRRGDRPWARGLAAAPTEKPEPPEPPEPPVEPAPPAVARRKRKPRGG